MPSIELSQKVVEKALQACDNGEHCCDCPLICVPKSSCQEYLRQNAERLGINSRGNKQ